VRRRAAPRRKDTFPIETHGVADDVLGLDAPAQMLHVDGLVLEHLVVQEESLQLAQALRRQFGDVVVVLGLGVVEVDGDDLVAVALSSSYLTLEPLGISMTARK